VDGAVKLRSVRVVTTLPLFGGAALAWWFGQEILAVVCALAAIALAVLQWMTVRALQHNAAPDPMADGRSVADREQGPL
jgi:hypothetical protein